MADAPPKLLSPLPALPEHQNESFSELVKTLLPTCANIPSVPDAPTFRDPAQLVRLGEVLIDYTLTWSIRNYLKDSWSADTSKAIRTSVNSASLLAAITRDYELFDLGPSESIQPSEDSALAATFKAYVGAIHEALGPVVTQPWLESLFTPYIQQAYPDLPRDTAQLASISATSALPIVQTSAPASAPLPQPAVPSQSSTPASTVQAPHGATMHLNEIIIRYGLEQRIAWGEKKVAGAGNSPLWRYDCYFTCSDGKKVVVGTGIDPKKKTAKNTASHEASRELRQRREIE